MLNLFSKKRIGVAGFTLIELLVVIAIIGVLASIVLASLNSARQKSRDARRLTDIKQIQLALELYFDGFGVGNYPVAITRASGCNATTAANGLEVLVTQGYIPAVPRDPNLVGTTDRCYTYSTAAANITTYHLGASLEDIAHSALHGDKDCRSDGTAPVCNGVTYVLGTTFVGGVAGPAESAGAWHDATVTTRRCYDVIQ